MNSWRAWPLVLVAGVASAAPQDAAPYLRGLDGAHGLDPAGVGALWLRELSCAACHASEGLAAQGRKQAPDLSRAGGRIDPVYLRSFLAAPGATQPGTTMPDVLGDEDPQERERVAEALAAYLIDLSPARFQDGGAGDASSEVGRRLFHEVGCAACHLPLGPGQDSYRGLEHVARKYGHGSLADFLFAPSGVRPSGRMPDCGLDAAESQAIAAFLLASRSGSDPAEPARPELVDEGRRHFETYRCSSCHALAGVAASPSSVRLEDVRPGHGCLAPEPSGVPDFRLDADQRRAIAAALEGEPRPVQDGPRLERELATFACLACHERDGRGGPHAGAEPFFTTTEPELGEEARLPPPLTGVGAKLQPDWLQEVLFDGASVRPYMRTRMPRFGEDNLRGLAELLARVDPPLAGVEVPQPLAEAEKKVPLEAGHLLMGDAGLSCISCHDYGGLKSQGFRGIDLMTTPRRLRPEWYVSYLIAPRSFRPGTVMPDYWPDGVAVQTEILAGDTLAQVHALWHYMALGRSGRTPSGLRPEPTRLEVLERPRLYRGRSRIAGFRGIAVGFPGGPSYAFDAQHGALCGLWLGDFLRVHWRGQSPGNFDPAARALQLARDVAFVRLSDPQAPWPPRPRTTEEAPVNPDPRYARDLGYRFEGYAFDAQGVPTLHYRSGDVRIEDRSDSTRVGGTPGLRRVLTLHAARAEVLHFRALSGEVAQSAPGEFSLAELTLHVPEVPHRLRPAPGGEGSELILTLKLEPGSTELVLDYVLSR